MPIIADRDEQQPIGLGLCIRAGRSSIQQGTDLSANLLGDAVLVDVPGLGLGQDFRAGTDRTKGETTRTGLRSFTSMKRKAEKRLEPDGHPCLITCPCHPVRWPPRTSSSPPDARAGSAWRALESSLALTCPIRVRRANCANFLSFEVVHRAAASHFAAAGIRVTGQSANVLFQMSTESTTQSAMLTPPGRVRLASDVGEQPILKPVRSAFLLLGIEGI